jgi:hypothetical protein
VKTLSALLVMAATLLCCCPFSWERASPPFDGTPVEIVGGYLIGRSVFNGLQLYAPPEPYYGDYDVTYRTIVYSEVARIGWDQDFILVERHPFNRAMDNAPDSSNPEWYIIVVSTGEVHSDLSYERFLSLREQLAIPENIEMWSAHEIYAHNAE